MQRSKRSICNGELRETRSRQVKAPVSYVENPDDLSSASEEESFDAKKTDWTSDTGSDNESDSDVMQTPTRKPTGLNGLRTPTVLATPKATSSLQTNQEFTPRRTPRLDKVLNTPTSESYFTAETRVKFRTLDSVRKAQEKKKLRELQKAGTKPRKGRASGINIPDGPLVEPTFSVTKESAKIDGNQEPECPWSTNHEEALQQLQQKLVQDFPRWIALLMEGFNIMLHGYGSKQSVILNFRDFLEDRFSSLIVNGMFPKSNARKLFDDVMDLMDISVNKFRGTPMPQLLEKIEDLVPLDAEPEPIILFVTNFDVLAVRNSQMLLVLSALARLKNVFLIATCDHINAGLGTSPQQTEDLNFVWTDATTYEHYQNELMWETNRFSNVAEGEKKTSIESVLKSLTTNAKKAFFELIKMQLTSQKSKRSTTTFKGIPFKQLLDHCRELYVAHSESALKSLLQEFIDHDFIRSAGKTKFDENNLIVNLDEANLEKYAHEVCG